jgi:hypothetical protein
MTKMTGTNKFKLTAKIKSRISHRKYSMEFGLKCYKCQKDLNIGEIIVSKGAPRKYHCLPCAKTLNLI